MKKLVQHVPLGDTNSTTDVAAESRVNPALPATAEIEFIAKWLNLYPRAVKYQVYFGSLHEVTHEL